MRKGMRAAAMLLVVALAACGGGGGGDASVSPPPTPPPTPRLTAIDVAPTNLSLPVGATRQMAATGRYDDGSTRDLTPTATWTSADATVVAFQGSPAGLLQARAAGSSTVTAVVSGISGTTTVTVPAPIRLTTLALVPAAVDAGVGERVQMMARGTYSDGAVRDVTALATWRTDDAAIAAFDAPAAVGRLAALAPGTTRASATLDAVVATAAVVVRAPPPPPVTLQAIVIAPAGPTLTVGDTLVLSATGRYSDGSTRDLSGTATWRAVATAIADFRTPASPATLTALSAGTTVVEATTDGVTGSTTVTVAAPPVRPPVLVGLDVRPTSPTLRVGDLQAFTASGRYDDGSTQDVTAQASWSSSDAAVAAFQSTSTPATLTARAAGQATVRATVGSVQGTTAVTVVVASTAMGPLRRSAANPRYFARPDGTVVLLAGAHTWANLLDVGSADPPTPFDYAGFLDLLERNGHNVFRLWAWEQARWAVENPDDGLRFAPHPFLRTGPGTALDGKPRFDLARWDEAYFTRLRSRVADARSRGMYVIVMLFNGWSVSNSKVSGGRNPWRAHPFHAANNVNGIDGDTNDDESGEETHRTDSAVLPFQRAYVRRVVDAVNEFDNVLYEISNESDAGATAWQYDTIEYLRAYQATKPNQHPIGMTVEWPGGTNAELEASTADWYSPNGSLVDPPAATGSKVVLADTDHLCGICGDRQWVWRAFTRGQNPLFMDGYDGRNYPSLLAGTFVFDDPRWVALRRSLGHVRALSVRTGLGDLVPAPSRTSTTFALASLGANPRFVVYQPFSGSFTVDLSGLSGNFTVEWIDPNDGASTVAGSVAAGAVRSFAPPFGGDAVLYLRR